MLHVLDKPLLFKGREACPDRMSGVLIGSAPDRHNAVSDILVEIAAIIKDQTLVSLNKILKDGEAAIVDANKAIVALRIWPKRAIPKFRRYSMTCR